MPSERIRRRLPHEAGQMFDLVADIERYPEFVPACTGIRVLRRNSSDGIDHVVAEMRIGYKLITERFTCRIRLDRRALAIDVDFIDGPFSRLANHWRFLHLSDGSCEVDFTIDVELKSRGLGLMVGALFDKVFLRFVDAFEKRADAVYGRPARPRARRAPA